MFIRACSLFVSPSFFFLFPANSPFITDNIHRLAVNYLFLVDDGAPTRTRTTPLDLEHFNAAHEQNDYEIPWSLRDVIADPRVSALFGKDIGELRDAFREWNPKTTILRELKRKLSPIQRLGAGSVGVGSVRSAESKL